MNTKSLDGKVEEIKSFSNKLKEWLNQRSNGFLLYGRNEKDDRDILEIPEYLREEVIKSLGINQKFLEVIQSDREVYYFRVEEDSDIAYSVEKTKLAYHDEQHNINPRLLKEKGFLMDLEELAESRDYREFNILRSEIPVGFNPYNPKAVIERAKE